MPENDALSSIQSCLDLEKSVTYAQVTKNSHLSPKDAQIYMKQFQDQHKEYSAIYLNVSEDNINHTLTLSHSLENGVFISLKSVKSDIFDLKQIYERKPHLDIENPPIISREIYLLPHVSNKEIKKENSEIPEECKTSSSQFISKLTPATVIPDKRSGLIKKTAIASSSKKTKEKASFFKCQPKKEEPIKTVASVNDFDSDFELSDSDVIVPKKTSPVKSKRVSNKPEIKHETNTSHTFNEDDVKSKNSLKNDKSKVRLFENFENVSPKRVLPKRHRMVIESDEEENDEKVLVEASFEEKKPPSTLKSHPSKRFKSENVVKHIESVEAPIKKQIIDSVCKPGFKKVEKTYKDEDGFLVVEKVLVPLNGDENVSQIRENSESIQAKQLVKTQSIFPTQLEKIEKKVGKKSKKVEAKGKQTNIMNFFQKNN